MRTINKIIIHCSATRAEFMDGHSAEAKRDEIRRWHVEDRGWSDIGYHLLIDRDGTPVEGRSFERIGAHTRGQNRDSIGICLIGGHGSSEKDDFADNFTPEQEQAVVSFLLAFSAQNPGPVAIHGHNEFAAKACPGFNVREWWAKKQDEIAGIAPEAANDPEPPVCIRCRRRAGRRW